jgi:hypothetical protein
MTADGLKCQACSVVAAPPVHELAGPAGPMPTKLQVVVALLGLGILLNFLTLSLLTAGIGVALLIGILVGNDGIRRFVTALAWINLVIGGFALAMILSAGSSQAVGVAIFGVVQNVFVIWTLGQEDVRNWMFKTAFKDGL